MIAMIILPLVPKTLTLTTTTRKVLITRILLVTMKALIRATHGGLLRLSHTRCHTTLTRNIS